MKTKSIMKALAQRNIVVVDVSGGKGRWFEAIVNGQRLSIYSQNGLVGGLHIKRVDEQDETASDYFPGHYFKRLKSVLRWLKI